MVLDPNSQAHVTGAAHPQQRHTTGRAPKSTGEGKPQRDPNRTVVQWNDVTVAESVILPSTRRQDSSANTTRELHPHDVERERGHEQQQHNLKREIENELSDPLLQSYLSTHSQQSTMLRSQNDVDNMSHSTINAFNKDTINNAAGVLNLLQTVRRIGREDVLATVFSTSSINVRGTTYHNNCLTAQVKRTRNCCCGWSTSSIWRNAAPRSTRILTTSNRHTAIYHNNPHYWVQIYYNHFDFCRNLQRSSMI